MCRAAKSKCAQRSGRTGRTVGGVAFRLFTRSFYESLPDFPVAETTVAPACHTVLLLEAYLSRLGAPNVVIARLPVPLTAEATALAVAKLREVEAISATGRGLTSLGKFASLLPIDVRQAKVQFLMGIRLVLDNSRFLGCDFVWPGAR